MREYNITVRINNNPKGCKTKTSAETKVQQTN